jgi:hypothetical protein
MKAAPGPASGRCVLAPVSNLMNIVDMKATVDYINGRISKDGHTSVSLLQADAVLTSRVDGQWRAQAYVVLRTATGAIPHLFNGLYFIAPGCELLPRTVHISHHSRYQPHTIHILHTPSAATKGRGSPSLEAPFRLRGKPYWVLCASGNPHGCRIGGYAILRPSGKGDIP